ncbi:MAG: SDR family NAD(P)-dependent oxidoreductase [Planctomycetota bacterium]
MKSFANRTALITGAASGIGLALAKALAREHCSLILVDVNAQGLQAAAASLANAPRPVHTLVCDLADPLAIEPLVQAAAKLSGGPDLLINNAGIALYGPTNEMTQEQWDQVLQVNLLAPVRITSLLLPTLLLKEDPHIVNMCSISGLVAGGRFTAYHTSKFGLVGFTEALRAEFGRRGVGVTAICPGPVLTSLYLSARNSRSGATVPMPPAWLCATPESVAARTLKAIRRNERQVLITPLAHFLHLLKRCAPSLIDWANQFSRHGRKRRLAAAAAATATTATAANAATAATASATAAGASGGPLDGSEKRAA